jgi:pyrroloquinoline quinone biosynthesis protein B
VRIRIIGSAAGGGFPQWNCNQRLSRLARQGAEGVRQRLQSSIAVEAGSGDWVLVNASPDIRQQIAATPELQPSADGPLRASPIKAVVLTNADVDHIAGLLSLRERQPFMLYATRRVLDVLEANPIFQVLDRNVVSRRELALDVPTAIEGPDGPTGIVSELYGVAGKVALYLETGGKDDFGDSSGDTVGVRLSSAGSSGVAHYVPGCAAVDSRLLTRIDGADALLFDGTVYTDDEMSQAGVGTKTGRRMGHVPITGDGGSLEALSSANFGRKVYVHINNTNPILDESSAPRRHVEASGWEVAHDGMEIRL